MDYSCNLYMFFSPPTSTFLIEGVLESKNLFSKCWWEWQKNYRQTHFHNLLAILDFAGGVVCGVHPDSFCHFWISLEFNGCLGLEEFPLGMSLTTFINWECSIYCSLTEHSDNFFVALFNMPWGINSGTQLRELLCDNFFCVRHYSQFIVLCVNLIFIYSMNFNA